MLMVSPVAGLRPSRAGRSETMKVPKFGTVILSFAASASANGAKLALNASGFDVNNGAFSVS